MNIKEKFLNENIKLIDDGKENNNDLLIKINEIRKQFKENSLNSKLNNSKKIKLSQKQLFEIINLYKIDPLKLEDRSFIKEIINKVNFNTEVDYPVVFQNNLLIVNKETVEKFLDLENTPDVLRELTQLLCLIKIEKVKSLKELGKIKGLEFDYTNGFKEVLSLEDKIIKKIEKNIDFSDLINYLDPLEHDLILKEEGRLIYENVVHQLEIDLFKFPENDNLIEFKDNKICFNMHSLNAYSHFDLNEDRKRELIQALYLIVGEQQENTSSHSQLLYNQKEKILSLIEKKLSEEDIESAIEKMPIHKKEITQVMKDKMLSILKVNEKNRFVIFEKGQVNIDNIELLMSENFKKEQIITYFIIECYKENHSIECKLINNKTIKFNQFEEMFYIEDLVQKQLTQYSLNDILQTIHDFKKNKIFNKDSEKTIENVISEKFVKKFSYNKANKEIIFINQSLCVFNEKLISQINTLDNKSLLEMYVLSQTEIIKELSENISVDKKIINLKIYQSKLIDKLKYKITEQDIVDSIDLIEQKSNTLIQSKEKILQDMSIELNAKEVKEIANDIVSFNYKEKELFLYSFNENICEKLLKKELNDLSKREFVQTLLLYEIKNKNMVLKTREGKERKIHDNFSQISKYIEQINEKLINKIKEEDIDLALDIITAKLEEDQFKTIINSIKKKVGIKTQSIFKNRL